MTGYSWQWMPESLISRILTKLKEHATTTELNGIDHRQLRCLSRTNEHYQKSIALQLPPEIHFSVKCCRSTNLFPLRYKKHYNDDGFLKCHNQYVESTLAHPSTALHWIPCKKEERFNICTGLILLHSKHLRKAVLEEAGQPYPLKVLSPVSLVLLLPLSQPHPTFKKYHLETEYNRPLSDSAVPGYTLTVLHNLMKARHIQLHYICFSSNCYF